MSEYEAHSGVQHVGAAHQLSPPLPWYRRRWILWTSLLLLLLLAMIVIMAVHQNEVKAAAAKSALAAVKPSVTATVATATKGDIGIYLDSVMNDRDLLGRNTGALNKKIPDALTNGNKVADTRRQQPCPH